MAKITSLYRVWNWIQQNQLLQLTPSSQCMNERIVLPSSPSQIPNTEEDIIYVTIYFDQATVSISACALLYNSSLFARAVRRSMIAGSSFNNEDRRFCCRGKNMNVILGGERKSWDDQLYGTREIILPLVYPDRWRNGQVGFFWPLVLDNKQWTSESSFVNLHKPYGHRIALLFLHIPTENVHIII